MHNKEDAIMFANRDRIRELRDQEQNSFISERPKTMELLKRAGASMPGGVLDSWMAYFYGHPPMYIAEAEGAYFSDIDGYRYLYMNQADTSMSSGYGPEGVAKTVCDRFRKGESFYCLLKMLFRCPKK
jgi:glutamate-1-semialdehyde 2,1-aminomutase